MDIHKFQDLMLKMIETWVKEKGVDPLRITDIEIADLIGHYSKTEIIRYGAPDMTIAFDKLSSSDQKGPVVVSDTTFYSKERDCTIKQYQNVVVHFPVSERGAIVNKVQLLLNHLGQLVKDDQECYLTECVDYTYYYFKNSPTTVAEQQRNIKRCESFTDIDGNIIWVISGQIVREDQIDFEDLFTQVSSYFNTSITTPEKHKRSFRIRMLHFAHDIKYRLKIKE